MSPYFCLGCYISVEYEIVTGARLRYYHGRQLKFPCVILVINCCR